MSLAHYQQAGGSKKRRAVLQRCGDLRLATATALTTSGDEAISLYLRVAQLCEEGTRDIDAAIEFFTELGLELEGRAPIEGDWAEGVTGLRDMRVEQQLDIAVGQHRSLCQPRIDRSPQAAKERDAFEAQQVRSETGLGASGSSGH